MKRLSIFIPLLLIALGCTPSYTDPNAPRPAKGSPQAQVVVEDFADFQCPACGQAYPILKQLQEQYGDRVLWKFRHFPLISIHPYAFNAALASECANDQGKFWEYHDLLYENQTKLTNSDLYSYAEQLSLDTESFKACYKSRAHSDIVRSDMTDAENQGVNSTPTLVVNGDALPNWTTIESRLASIFSTSTPSGQ